MSTRKPSRVVDSLALVGFLLVCLLAGGLGSIATTPELDGWYRTLAKPTWNPPGWVFGPVWTTLYVLMAVAAWLVWRRDGLRGAAGPLALFGLQLLLNISWSWIFFRGHALGWASVEIMLLWLAIAATMWSFFRRSRPAGWLLAPYLGWVSFAAVLTCIIWRMNSIP